MQRIYRRPSQNQPPLITRCSSWRVSRAAHARPGGYFRRASAYSVEPDGSARRITRGGASGVESYLPPVRRAA